MQVKIFTRRLAGDVLGCMYVRLCVINFISKTSQKLIYGFFKTKFIADTPTLFTQYPVNDKLSVQNEWPKIYYFHTDHFLSGISVAL